MYHEEYAGLYLLDPCPRVVKSVLSPDCARHMKPRWLPFQSMNRDDRTHTVNQAHERNRELKTVQHTFSCLGTGPQ